MREMKQYCDDCASEKRRQLADWEVSGGYLCNAHRVSAGYLESDSGCKRIGLDGVPMEKAQEKRTCSVTGCEKEIRKNNKTGRCSAHFYQPRGKREDLPPGVSPKVSEVVFNGAPKEASKVGLPQRMTMIPVSEAALDSFWEQLGVEEKGEIFSSYIAREGV